MYYKWIFTFTKLLLKINVMEYHIIHKQFFIAFAGLSCGIISILFGGFGNIFWDKTLHIIIYFAVVFINFYLLQHDKKKHLFKIIALTIFVFVYSILINLFLLFWGVLIMTILLVFPKNKSNSIPDIYIDSPLSFGIKNIPIWKIIILFLYCIPVYILWSIFNEKSTLKNDWQIIIVWKMSNYIVSWVLIGWSFKDISKIESRITSSSRTARLAMTVALRLFCLCSIV